MATAKSNPAAKKALKSTVAVAKPAGAVAPKAAKAAKTATTAKASKPRKEKLVRDSFTIPKSEYLVFDVLKQRAAKLGAPAKKSELLRAGIKALAAMAETPFATALKNVPTIKTGRPSKT